MSLDTKRRRPVYPNTYLLKPCEQTNAQWIAEDAANEHRFSGLLAGQALSSLTARSAAEPQSFFAGRGLARCARNESPC